MLLILVALGLAVFGVIRFASTLEPRQRVVLILVFVVGLVLLVLKLTDLGLLGRRTGATGNESTLVRRHRTNALVGLERCGTVSVPSRAGT